MITRLIGRREMRRRRSSCRPQLVTEQARTGAFLIYSYCARDRATAPALRLQPGYGMRGIYIRLRPNATAGRPLDQSAGREARGCSEGQRRKERGMYTPQPTYIIPFPGDPSAPRRDRRHAHLCVSWAGARRVSFRFTDGCSSSCRLLLLPPFFVPRN